MAGLEPKHHLYDLYSFCAYMFADMTETVTGIGDMNLPKYVRNRNGTYHYQRDFPTRLRHLCHTKTFTHPLKLFANNATNVEVAKAAIESAEAYDRQIALISNSDPDALSATDKDKAVVDFLRKRGLKSGQFLKVAKNSDITALEEAGGGQMQPHEYSYAEWAIPEFDEVLNKQNRGEPLTAQDRVIGDSYMALTNRARAKPRTLGSLWPEYAEYREIDPTSRNGKKALKYWNRWIGLAGDTLISPNTQAHINEGIDAYVRDRAKYVSSQTLRRELGDVTACLRMAADKHRFDWTIRLPRFKETKPNSRHPLEPHQQVELVRAILDPQGTINPKYGAAMLLCLQGGMMVSEIERLQSDDIGLEADIPHIKIVNETKTEDRMRIVPIVLGLDLIKQHLSETIKWLRGSTESTPSGTLKKIMRRTIDSATTSPHCLRHTLKINGQNAGVSVLTIASIAGWADPQRKVSRHLLSYGSTGISQSKIVQILYQDSRRMHEHLIALEISGSDNIVIPFKGETP